MLGTIVNAAAILAGGAIGLLLKKGLSQRMSDIIMSGLALCVIYIGIDGCLEGANALIPVISIVLGAIIGTLLDLQGCLERLGQSIQRRFAGADESSTFAKGLVTASLLFCVGAMAMVGSLQSGLAGDHSTLFTKALIDGISALIFSASLGVGVLFSAVFVFVYQGAITLLAQVLAPVFCDGAIAEMTCVGSLLIIGIGLNMLGVTKLRLMNYVPGVFVAIGVYYAFNALGLM